MKPISTSYRGIEVFELTLQVAVKDQHRGHAIAEHRQQERHQQRLRVVVHRWQMIDADAVLVASVVHYGEYTCGQLKEYLHDRGVVRRIVDAIDPGPEDHIVEIGPGQGAVRAGHIVFPAMAYSIDRLPDQQGRVAIVTGAASGIGRASARRGPSRRRRPRRTPRRRRAAPPRARPRLRPLRRRRQT